MKPFLYALMRPNGTAEISEMCVAEGPEILGDEAEELGCTVVPLYRALEVTDEMVEVARRVLLRDRLGDDNSLRAALTEALAHGLKG